MKQATLGLTGSIGMGKSTTAKMFAQHGCDVWDADAAVHRMYAKGGPAVQLIADVHPAAITDGAVDRSALKGWISLDDMALAKIEAIVHPLVRQDRSNFKIQSSSDIIVFDIPLLFETKAEGEFDYTACVYVSEQEQLKRVMTRNTMSLDHFEFIKAKQMPMKEKMALADFTIPTDSIENAQKAVQHIVSTLKQSHA